MQPALASASVPLRGDDLREALRCLLDAARCGAADAGEVIATSTRVAEGDADGWVQEWSAAAGVAWAAAKAAAAAGRAESARSHYATAASYYAAALVPIGRTRDADRQLDLWRRQRECWDRAVALRPTPAARLEIPYGEASLPAYLFHAPDAHPGESRGLVLMNNGDVETTSQMLLCGGAAAAARGYHWLAFDGPGQQAALYERGLPAELRWERVLTAVLDAVVQRPEVDARRLALVGVGQGAFWAARAICFEHRFSAAVLRPGVLDVLQAWTRGLPCGVLTALRERDRQQFAREMHLTELICPASAATFDRRAHQYGVVAANGWYELFEVASAYRLGEELAALRTPTLIVDEPESSPWHGQSAALQRRLGDVGELIPWSSVAGGQAAREALVFDWLDERLKRGEDSGGPQLTPVADPQLLHRAVQVGLDGAHR